MHMNQSCHLILAYHLFLMLWIYVFVKGIQKEILYRHQRIFRIKQGPRNNSYLYPSLYKIENILDKMIAKKTKHKEYFQYLVKWKGHPAKDATCMNTQQLQQQGFILEDIVDSSFVPQEYDVGASPHELQLTSKGINACLLREWFPNQPPLVSQLAISF